MFRDIHIQVFLFLKKIHIYVVLHTVSQVRTYIHTHILVYITDHVPEILRTEVAQESWKRRDEK